MTVISVDEIGRGKRRGQIGQSFVSGYSRHFMVKTNTPYDGVDEVIGPASAAYALGLPVRGAYYFQPQTGFTDLTSLCITISASQQQEDDEQKWLVECGYSSEYQPPVEFFNPNQDLPLFRWSNEKGEKAMECDLNSIPVTTSAGEPFKAVKKDKWIRTLTMTRNEPFFNKDLADLLIDSVNLNPQWGYGRGQVNLVEYSANGPLYRNGIEYWAHTYVFRMDRTPVGSDTTTGSTLSTPGYSSLSTGGGGISTLSSGNYPGMATGSTAVLKGSTLPDDDGGGGDF